MPDDGPAGSGVAAAVQVRPPSLERSTRAVAAAPVPSQTCRAGWVAPDAPDTGTVRFVPLAANAPSFGSAGGSPAAGAGVQVAPPSAVSRRTKRPSTESLTATPRRASQKTIASKNAFSSRLTNCVVHV